MPDTNSAARSTGRAASGRNCAGSPATAQGECQCAAPAVSARPGDRADYSATDAIAAAAALQIDLVARWYLAVSVRCDVTVEMPHLARLETYHRVRQCVADLLAERDDVLLFTKDVEETGLLLKGEEAAAVQADSAVP